MARNYWQIDCAGLKHRFTYLFKEKLWTDCEFRVGEVTIKAHRLILAMSSSVFADMFYGVNAVQEPVVINNVRPEVFNALLEYIYSDELTITSCNDALDVYLKALDLRLHVANQKCSDYIRVNLAPENVGIVYQMASERGIDDLQKATEDIFCNKTYEVLRHPNFYEISLDLLKKLFSLEPLHIVSELDLYRVLVKYSMHRELKATANARNLKRMEPTDPLSDSVEDQIPTKKSRLSSQEEKDGGSGDNMKLNQETNLEKSETKNANSLGERRPSTADSLEEASSTISNSLHERSNEEINPDYLVDYSNKQEYRDILNKIRLLTINAADFANCNELSVLLNESERLAVLMNIITLYSNYGMPDGLSTTYVPRSKITLEERQRLATVFRSSIQNIKYFSRYSSPFFYLRNLAWYVEIHRQPPFGIKVVVTCILDKDLGPPEWLKSTKVKLRFTSHQNAEKHFQKIPLTFRLNENAHWVTGLKKESLRSPDYAIIDENNTAFFKVYVNTVCRPESPTISVSECNPNRVVLRTNNNSALLPNFDSSQSIPPTSQQMSGATRPASISGKPMHSRDPKARGIDESSHSQPINPSPPISLSSLIESKVTPAQARPMSVPTTAISQRASLPSSKLPSSIASKTPTATQSPLKRPLSTPPVLASQTTIDNSLMTPKLAVVQSSSIGKELSPILTPQRTLPSSSTWIQRPTVTSIQSPLQRIPLSSQNASPSRPISPLLQHISVVSTLSSQNQLKTAHLLATSSAPSQFRSPTPLATIPLTSQRHSLNAISSMQSTTQHKEPMGSGSSAVISADTRSSQTQHQSQTVSSSSLQRSSAVSREETSSRRSSVSNETPSNIILVSSQHRSPAKSSDTTSLSHYSSSKTLESSENPLLENSSSLSSQNPSSSLSTPHSLLSINNPVLSQLLSPKKPTPPSLVASESSQGWLTSTRPVPSQCVDSSSITPLLVPSIKSSSSSHLVTVPNPLLNSTSNQPITSQVSVTRPLLASATPSLNSTSSLSSIQSNSENIVSSDSELPTATRRVPITIKSDEENVKSSLPRVPSRMVYTPPPIDHAYAHRYNKERVSLPICSATVEKTSSFEQADTLYNSPSKSPDLLAPGSPMTRYSAENLIAENPSILEKSDDIESTKDNSACSSINRSPNHENITSHLISEVTSTGTVTPVTRENLRAENLTLQKCETQSTLKSLALTVAMSLIENTTKTIPSTVAYENYSPISLKSTAFVLLNTLMLKTKNSTADIDSEEEMETKLYQPLSLKDRSIRFLWTLLSEHNTTEDFFLPLPLKVAAFEFLKSLMSKNGEVMKDIALEAKQDKEEKLHQPPSLKQISICEMNVLLSNSQRNYSEIEVSGTEKSNSGSNESLHRVTENVVPQSLTRVALSALGQIWF